MADDGKLHLILEGQSWDWLVLNFKALLQSAQQGLTAFDPNDYSAILAAIGRIEVLRVRRNTVIHSVWQPQCLEIDAINCMPPPKGRSERGRIFHFVKSRYRKAPIEQQLAIEDVEDIAREIEDVVDELEDLVGKADERRWDLVGARLKRSLDQESKEAEDQE